MLAAQFAVHSYGERPRLAELIEVQRQIGLLHSHRVLHVPRHEIFILEEIALTISDGSLLPQPHPLCGFATTVSTAPLYRGGRVQRADHRVELRTDTGLHATGRSTAFFVPARTYRRLQERLRDGTKSSTYEPAATMRETLTVDTRDPILSDHQNDHVSGMAVICAIERFFAEHASQMSLKSLTLRFERHLTTRPPAVLAFRFPTPTAFEGEAVQEGTPGVRFVGELVEREE
jgi:hypothetical protein